VCLCSIYLHDDLYIVKGKITECYVSFRVTILRTETSVSVDLEIFSL